MSEHNTQRTLRRNVLPYKCKTVLKCCSILTFWKWRHTVSLALSSLVIIAFSVTTSLNFPILWNVGCPQSLGFSLPPLLTCWKFVILLLILISRLWVASYISWHLRCKQCIRQKTLNNGSHFAVTQCGIIILCTYGYLAAVWWSGQVVRWEMADWRWS